MRVRQRGAVVAVAALAVGSLLAGCASDYATPSGPAGAAGDNAADGSLTPSTNATGSPDRSTPGAGSPVAAGSAPASSGVPASASSPDQPADGSTPRSTNPWVLRARPEGGTFIGDGVGERGHEWELWTTKPANKPLDRHVIVAVPGGGAMHSAGPIDDKPIDWSAGSGGGFNDLDGTVPAAAVTVRVEREVGAPLNIPTIGHGRHAGLAFFFAFLPDGWKQFTIIALDADGRELGRARGSIPTGIQRP